MQPSSRSDAVGDIGEFVRTVDLDEVLEDGCLDQVGVQFCNAVDFVTANKSQVRHADHFRLRLLYDRNTSEHFTVLGEVTFDVLQELKVDVVDDLEMARKEMLHKWDRPLLQRLWQDCVVGVTECCLHDAPSLVPLKAFLIDQDALKLRDGKRWVSVIQL